nr:MAG TPA: Intermediate conductance calcium-activated potassium channel-helix bundle, copper, MEMBRANE PROTEIN [Caudoviricetes sp.]
MTVEHYTGKNKRKENQMKQNLNVRINGTNFRPGNELGIGFELESADRKVFLSGSIATDVQKGQQAFFNQTAHLLVLDELAKVLTEDNEKGSIAVTEVKSELEKQIKEKDERITALEKQVTELLLMFTNEEAETETSAATETNTPDTTNTDETHA